MRSRKTTRSALLTWLGVVLLGAFAAAWPVDAQQDCWTRERTGSHSLSSNTDDAVRTVRWSIGDCSGELRIKGDLTFDAAFTRIVGISRGGEFRYEEDDGRTERRLVITPAGSELNYDYRVDGRTQSWDAGAQAWFQSALVNVFRGTGLEAEGRAAAILRSGGVPAVLREIELMESDFVQRQYFAAVLNQDLPPAQLHQILTLAGEELGSDFELATLLIAIAQKNLFDDDTRDAFLAAQRSIGSDFEQRRVLSSVLAHGRLTPNQIGTVLESAESIGSDFERASLLVDVAKFDLSTPVLREAYLRAASDIGSDFELRRALSALLSKTSLATAEQALVLGAAKSIGSDFELAQLLLQLLSENTLEESLEDEFMEALESIDSSHEYGRVAAALLRGRSGG